MRDHAVVIAHFADTMRERITLRDQLRRSDRDQDDIGIVGLRVIGESVIDRCRREFFREFLRPFLVRLCPARCRLIDPQVVHPVKVVWEKYLRIGDVELQEFNGVKVVVIAPSADALRILPELAPVDALRERLRLVTFIVYFPRCPGFRVDLLVCVLECLVTVPVNV